MVAPTASEILAVSKFNFAEAGYADATAVQPLVDSAGQLLLTITGQTWDLMPVGIQAMAKLAIRGLTEQLAMQSTPEYLETLSDFDLIQSFSAGPYSETRRSPEDALKARRLNAWPWLSDLLWRMLTPDQNDYWLAYFSGLNAPAFAVTEMEWDPYLAMADPNYIWGA